MRFTNLFEARHIGASRYITFVEQAKVTINKRVNAVNAHRHEFNDWKEACEWVSKTFDLQGACESSFIESEDMSVKEAQQAVNDFTERYGNPSIDTQFQEHIYTWWFPNDIALQVFTADNDDIAQKLFASSPFMIVYHGYGMDPTQIISS